MRKVLLGILVILLIGFTVEFAFGWDFSMKGQFEWRYRYFGRANGYQDLFGDMRLQDNALINHGFGAGTGPIGFAGLNLWRGYSGNNSIPMQTGSTGTTLRIVRGGFSYADCDGSEYDQRMTFEPEIKVNNAMRFRFNVDLAAIRQKYNHRDFQTNGPLDRWYQDRLSQNAFDTAMLPSINMLHFTAQTPWGILSAGPKGVPWGINSFLALNTRAPEFTFVVPYGPFRFIALFEFCQNPYGFGPFVPYGPIPNDPLDPASGHTGPPPNSVVNMDNGQHYQISWGPFFVYESGPIELGGALISILQHINNANLLGMTGNPGYRPVYYQGVFGPPTIYSFGGEDQAYFLYMAYLKYNNGRFFWNSETWFANLDNTFVASGQVPRPGAQFLGSPPVYVEASSAIVETGALCGPAKLSFLFAWSGGQALNNNNPTKAYNGLAIDYQPTDAYNYLLFHTYGGGNDAPWAAGVSLTQDEMGQMADAWALAARLDYAVAANLNMWGTYMWANRVEQNGWLAGQKDYNGNPATGTGFAGMWTAADAVRWKNYAMPGAGGNMNPYVDDCYLGWEGQIGVDWKLLENLTVSSRFAYWQPGPWFDQAYQVVGLNNAGTAAPTSTAPGTLGGFLRGRSAIQSFSSSIFVDF